MPCEIQVSETEWEGVRRKYWHGRDTYYLPQVTWKTSNATATSNGDETNTGSDKDDEKVKAQDDDGDNGTNVKRQKVNESQG